MARSFMACLAGVLLRLNRSGMEGAKRDLADASDKMHYDIPSKIRFPRPVSKVHYGQMEVFEAPASDGSDNCFLFIHGGAYCHQALPFHWRFLSEMAKRTGCGFSSPNYPMTPKYTCAESFGMMMDYYREFSESHDMSKVVMGGDSAGGSYALLLAQKAKEQGLALPGKLVLLSPYVDVSGADKSMDRYDAMLQHDTLLEFGKAWAGSLDLKDPLVSPLYGDMEGLPKTAIWVGTWGILYREIMQLYEKMKDCGVDVTLYEGQKMGHVYPLYPMREGASARDQIVSFIQS